MAHARLVTANDILGRCCFDSKDAKPKRPRSRFIRRSFVNSSMSVDQLTGADHVALTNLHDSEAASRTPPRNFHGWWTFEAISVWNNGWSITLAPTHNNRWHAEVNLSESTEEEDTFKQKCSKLASLSVWQGRSFLASGSTQSI